MSSDSLTSNPRMSITEQLWNRDRVSVAFGRARISSISSSIPSLSSANASGLTSESSVEQRADTSGDTAQVANLGWKAKLLAYWQQHEDDVFLV
ncbi:hypothetical protein BC830DRAFT_1169067 [Chytriomyces sp. MP71]|nr:hypothetical protein BC830DRAFT_1169067 [Chytriomyces sp. MP71]